MQVADERKIPVLEDCAQCNGGSFQESKVGTFGKVGIFSLQINKNVTAGEGGLIVTNDDALYKRLVATHDVGVPWENNAPNETSDVQFWGQGRRMGELAGSVANVQLRRLPDIVTHMRGSKQRIKSARRHPRRVVPPLDRPGGRYGAVPDPSLRERSRRPPGNGEP
jgi:8-amino-3,8-dideoxy-alpha-D-manno-octulosonate transaminase